MTNESIYELQKIDCNCNDCKFMIRDFETYNKWRDWHRKIDLHDFEVKKAKAIKDALTVQDEKQKDAMLGIARKMKFQFDSSHLLQYGKCTRFKKLVSFIPVTIQMKTQNCFIHRRDAG